MKTPFAIFAVITLLTSYLAAHQDPRGDIRPRFQSVEGKLKVVYRVNFGNSSKYKIATVLKDALFDTVEILESEAAELEVASPPGTWLTSNGNMFIFGSEHAGKPCVFKIEHDRPKLIMPKWNDEPKNGGITHSYAITDKHYIFLVGTLSVSSFSFNDFHVYMFDRLSLELTHHIPVGVAEGIIHEPTYSHLAVLDNTVYFCWSKKNDNDSSFLVMNEISATGKVREHVICKDFHWNALVDLTVAKGSVFIVYDQPDFQNLNSTIKLYRHHTEEHRAPLPDSK